MRFAIIYLLMAGVVFAQTSDVVTVKAWTRDYVMGIPGGGLIDASGTIADAQRYEAAQASIAASSNLVAAANTGFTNAMERLYAVTNRVDDFTNRIYIAADMGEDPGYSNIWSAVMGEYVDGKGDVHYLCYYSHVLAVPPQTVWCVALDDDVRHWVDGVVATNNVLTNCNGYACYDISITLPEAVGNVVLRAERHMVMGAEGTPLDINDAGINLIKGGVEREPFTGAIVRTNALAGVTNIVSRNYLSGLLYNTTTNVMGELL